MHGYQDKGDRHGFTRLGTHDGNEDRVIGSWTEVVLWKGSELGIDHEGEVGVDVHKLFMEECGELEAE